MLSHNMQSHGIPRQLAIKLLASAYPAFPAGKRKGGFGWHHGRCGSTAPGRILKPHPGIR